MAQTEQLNWSFIFCRYWKCLTFHLMNVADLSLVPRLSPCSLFYIHSIHAMEGEESLGVAIMDLQISPVFPQNISQWDINVQVSNLMVCSSPLALETRDAQSQRYYPPIATTLSVFVLVCCECGYKNMWLAMIE